MLENLRTLKMSNPLTLLLAELRLISPLPLVVPMAVPLKDSLRQKELAKRLRLLGRSSEGPSWAWCQ